MAAEDERWENLKELLNGSPFYRYMNMRVVEAGDGRSKLTMEAKDDMHNLYGMLHGGAIATIMDSSCSIATGSLLKEGEICVTADLRINYISNLSRGTLTGEGRALHRGNKTGVSMAEVRDPEGNLVAAEMSTQLIIRPGDVRLSSSA